MEASKVTESLTHSSPEMTQHLSLDPKYNQSIS